MHRKLTNTDLRRASLAPFRLTLAEVIRNLRRSDLAGTLLTPALRPKKKVTP